MYPFFVADMAVLLVNIAIYHILNFKEGITIKLRNYS
jgi:hypothetical protein